MNHPKHPSRSSDAMTGGVIRGMREAGHRVAAGSPPTGSGKRVRETAVPKILIVDDDPDILEAGRLVLEKEGYEVVCASNRAEGMAQIGAAAPDLLILDVMMESPDDGFVMAQDLRREGCDLPIMMLTSVGTATGMNFGRDDEMVPVDDFQSKPVDPATLVAKVKTLLS
jgi:DNA-binding response OmpR family regulator